MDAGKLLRVNCKLEGKKTMLCEREGPPVEGYIFDLLMRNDGSKNISKEKYEVLVTEADSLMLLEEQQARYKRDRSVMVISNAYLFDLRELRDLQMTKGKSSQLIKTIGRKIQTLEMLIELLMEGQD